MNDSTDGRGRAVVAAPQAEGRTIETNDVRLEPLKLLIPYIERYRTQAIGAGIALLVAAIATLAVPIAVRRMMDHGFTPGGAAVIDNYFPVLILVAAVLGTASATRFYLVTTLGERIVADLREEVFGHLTKLSPAFFARPKSGELLSRLTADTT